MSPSKRKKFGRLTVVALARQQRGKRVVALAYCLCDCGKRVGRPIFYGNLASGHTQSCGCLLRERTAEANKTHGMSRGSRAYRIWASMIQRCEDRNSTAYHNYGGRGIRVHRTLRRFADFWNYIKTLDGVPAGSVDVPIGLTIDRIDNDGDYRCGNIRLISMADQAKNRRNNTRYTINGVTKIKADWCRLFGVSEQTVRRRIKSGLTVEQAFRRQSHRGLRLQ